LVQAAFGRFRADLLERLAAVCIPLAAALDLLTRKRLAVTIGCQIHNAQIDAKCAFGVNRFRRFDLAGNEQIPLASDERQIGFSALCSKQFALTLATDERDRLPPVECPDRDFRPLEVVGQDAIVVGDRAMGLKRALCLAIELIGIRDFADTTNRQLRCQAECLTYRLIGQFVDRKLAKRPAPPCHLTDVVARGVGRLKRAAQRISLFRRWKQLDGGGQSHIMSMSQSERPCKYALKRAEAWRFLPPLKRAGFRA
jgi:hypothetical protein